MKSSRILIPLLLGLAFTGGCATGPSALDPARLGPFFQPTNIARDDRLPAEMRRVVLLPVHAGTLAPIESANAIDDALLNALQRQLRFEVVVLSRDDCRRLFGAAEFSSAGPLPHGFLAKIAEQYGADGVVFTDLTAFRPFRPLALGIRAKLATTADIRLVWAFDEIFAADDSAVANSVRHYHMKGDRHTPFDLSSTALISPSRYAAYVADAVFSTLPPR